jgi:hypothetical protein
MTWTFKKLVSLEEEARMCKCCNRQSCQCYIRHFNGGYVKGPDGVTPVWEEDQGYECTTHKKVWR